MNSKYKWVNISLTGRALIQSKKQKNILEISLKQSESANPSKQKIKKLSND